MAHNVEEIIARIQHFVYPRRPRIKENFVDHDPLRSGTISFSRFVRGVASIGLPGLQEAEIECVGHHFERPSGDVDYIKFVAAVDAVFGPLACPNPTETIPPSGHTVPPMFTPNPTKDEDKLHAVMHRLSLLTKTRGVVMKYVFQDFERGDSTSLLGPRRCGKITHEVFRRMFPFQAEFSSDEMDMLLHRYSVDGLINYMALHDDVTDRANAATEALSREELPRSDFIPPDLSGVQWTHDDLSAVDRIQARVVERRLRPRDYFQDFDPLKKGYCTVRQARTVLSVMNVPVSDEDFEQLCMLYCRPGDEMFHYAAFHEKIDAVFATKGLEMFPLTRTNLPSPEDTLGTRQNKVKGGYSVAAGIKHSSLSEGETPEYIELLERKVRARVEELRLPMKIFFEDFDKTSQGHVTSSQFMRVLTSMSFPLSMDDMKLLAAKYCDRGTLRDVNYKEFCKVVSPIDPNITLAEKQSTMAYSANKSSAYFSKGNEVIPAK